MIPNAVKKCDFRNFPLWPLTKYDWGQMITQIDLIKKCSQNIPHFILAIISHIVSFVPLNFLSFCSCISSAFPGTQNVVARKTWPNASGWVLRMSNDSTLIVGWAAKASHFFTTVCVCVWCESNGVEVWDDVESMTSIKGKEPGFSEVFDIHTDI